MSMNRAFAEDQKQSTTRNIYRQWSFDLTKGPLRVSEYYDKLSNSYRELYMTEQKAKHQKVLELIGNNTFGTFLDIGSGTGELLYEVESRSAMTIGLDLSKGMLERSRVLVSARKTDLVIGDARHLPFRDCSVDCVVSVSVADEQSASSVLHEATRVARPQAATILSVFHPTERTPSCIQWDRAEHPERCALSPRETLYFWQRT